jgi:hypothetical protein
MYLIRADERISHDASLGVEFEPVVGTADQPGGST